MVKDQQVRRLFKLIHTEKNFGTAAIKAGMDEKTARKYRRLGKLPSELEQSHTWRTDLIWDYYEDEFMKKNRQNTRVLYRGNLKDYLKKDDFVF